MDNRKTYIIADLVKVLDVPRTTLKDWLVRYEHYIEFEIRGHRKIYFDSSLEVLNEIKEMRDNGLSAAEIISELSSRQSLTPELPGEIEAGDGETLPAVNKAASLEGLLMVVKRQNEQLERILVEKLQDTASDMHEAQIAALLPIVKRQHEKIERILTGKFQDLASNFHRTQLDANQLFKQQSHRLLLLLALVFITIIAVVLTSTNIFYMLKGQKEKFKYAEIKIGENIDRNRELFTTEAHKNSITAAKQQQQLKEISATLNSDNQTLKKDIAAMKVNMDERSKRLDSSLKEYKDAMLEQQKKDMQELKTALENEYRDLLKKMSTAADAAKAVAKGATEAAEKEAAQSAVEMKKLKDEIAKLRAKAENLEQEKIKSEKTRIPVMIFPGAVPPDMKSDGKK